MIDSWFLLSDPLVWIGGAGILAAVGGFVWHRLRRTTILVWPDPREGPFPDPDPPYVPTSERPQVNIYEIQAHPLRFRKR